MADRTVHPTPEWRWPEGSVWDVFVAVRALAAASDFLAECRRTMEMLEEAGYGRR